jgi:general secretion pathway protein K
MIVAAGRSHTAKNEGFALLVVIWIIGLISIIALTVITTSHYRVKAAVNGTEVAKAASLAEAGVTLAKLTLINRSSLSPARVTGGGALLAMPAGRSPVFCALPQGGVAAIVIEDEGGKIDLNFASRELLSALLVGLGLSEPQANQTASNIAIFARVSGGGRNNQDYVGAKITEGRRFGPKHAPFETPLELDQVEGISRDLFEAMLPFVTVVSRRPGVDPQFAAPALLAALSRRAPQAVLSIARVPATMNELAAQIANTNDPIERSFTSSSSQTAFLIDAEVMTPGGGFFAREVVVEWQAANGGLLTREWRRGRGRYHRILAQQIQDKTPWPDC